MKRFFALFLALVMSLALAAPAFAAEPDDPTDPGEGETVIQPRRGYLIVDDPVSGTGSPWVQPAGYKYYRVWVQNTSGHTMRVTLKYPDGTLETKTLEKDRAEVLFESDNAAEGDYIVSFSTDWNYGSGTVRVRVSDLPI